MSISNINEVITSIQNVKDIEYNCDYWLGYDIHTSKQTISVLIDDHHICCERFNVLLITPTHHTKEDMIGAELTGDVGWGKYVLDEYFPIVQSHEKFFYDDTPHAIVNVPTNKGLIQLIAYNEHNGHYCHHVCVEWDGYEDVQKI